MKPNRTSNKPTIMLYFFILHHIIQFASAAVYTKYISAEELRLLEMNVLIGKPLKLVDLFIYLGISILSTKSDLNMLYIDPRPSRQSRDAPV